MILHTVSNIPFPIETLTCPTSIVILPISVKTFPTPTSMGLPLTVALALTLTLVPDGSVVVEAEGVTVTMDESLLVS